MRITSGGNVGIGTSSPDYRLSIQNTGAGPTGAWQTFKDSAGVTQWGISEYSAGDLNFYEAGVADGRLYLKAGGNVLIGTTTDGGTHKLQVNGTVGVGGNLTPTSNNSYNLGSASLGWANVYTNDLHLSNMNKPEGNDIDGTSGNWTIQEGAENLYIINNNNGKKFKISLEEII
jgi:hypothetical protein